MIVAFDFSPTMISHTKIRLAKLKPIIPNDKLKLFQLDLSSKLPFEDDKFDGIVSNLVITYVNKHEHHLGKDALSAILKELRRILKPGGVLVWSTPKKGVNFFYVFLGSIFNILNPLHAERLLYGPLILRHARYIEKKAKLGLYNFLSKVEILEILQQIGYNNIEINTSFAGQALVIKSQK
ncbi:MAG: class I SAM-dependent methyltransferase [Candidatus Komeilibacteria bacterium]|nr:class I SAM-dependent methyltransferase [Candidatus Komeilibacteria bacterium]